MPNDAAFDPGTGTFVWTPPESEVGRVVDLVFVASDGVFITYQTVEIAVIAAPPVTGCQDDSAERNDDFPQASDLAPGTYQFNICDTAEVTDDWDIFRLSLTDGQTLEVIVTFDHLKSDIDIELFASDENEVLADSYDVGNVEQFTYVAQGDRIVYLLVYEIGEEGTASDYTLEVKVSNTPPVCQEDDLEEDDTFVQATPLNRPQETISGLIACPMDPDHFRISLNAHDSLTVTVTPAPGVLMAQIYAPDQATQLASVSMAVMTTNLVVTDVAQTGDYWVRVESFGRTPYTLGALVTPLQYKWVRIKDDPANQSLVNCYFNPGADIDSIELIRNGTGIGWATEVVATGLGTQCVKNTAADPAKVLGPMDELNYWDPNNLFLSLNSGEVVVAFGDGAGGLQDIRSGDQIRVTSWDHSGEAYSDVYHVTLCNDSACAVAIELGSNSGVATFDISY